MPTTLSDLVSSTSHWRHRADADLLEERSVRNAKVESSIVIISTSSPCWIAT